MPLIDIQTNLKDLKYGDFGSESPFVTKDINNPPDLRGLEKAAQRRIDDLTRFRKFLVSGRGVNWVANQGALNVVEAGIKARKGGGSRSLAGQIVSGAWSTAKLVASTVAQIGVSGTGTHFVEGFGGRFGYLRRVQGHVLALQGGNINTQGIIENVNDVEVGKRESRILGQYLTPGALTGDTPKKNVIQKIFGGGNPKLDQLEYRVNNFQTGSVYDPTPGNLNNLKQHSLNLSGSANFNREKQGFVEGADIISLRKPITGSVEDIIVKQAEGKLQEGDTATDLINFNIKTILPAGSVNDGPTVELLSFRAYLDSLSDSYSGEWAGTKYIGRAEELYTYGGFSRNLSVGFKIAASSAFEMKPLYEKLNRLAGTTAPSYLNSTFMRGVFTTLTVGDFVKDLPGIITSLELSWNTDYLFSSKDDDADVGELPTVLDVTMAFQPVHRFAPEYGRTFIGDPKKLNNSADITA